MSAVCNVPLETLRGCVVRRLHRGQPRYVFVQHLDAGKVRAVCLVLPTVEGGFKTDGTRANYDGDEACPMAIAAAYLEAYAT